MMSRSVRILTAAAGLALVGACTGEDALVRPATDTPGGELFARYVALGNSITAGYQSGGINDSTQVRAYPVLLAQQAGVRATFGVPLLAGPECSPLAAPFTTTRVAPRFPTPPGIGCLRVGQTPPLVNNLAVPGALMASATNLTPGANALTTFVLGGRTPADAMVASQPSLVSVWLGNNDALAAALSGNPGALTEVGAFQQSLDALVARIRDSGAQDAILIGVVNPVIVPALQPGVFAWLVKQNPQTAPLLPNPVSDNCAPVGLTGQPNPLAFNLVSLQIVGQTVPGTSQLLEISCANDAPYVLNPTESNLISARVSEFNNLLQARATDHGWVWLDPNQLLGQFVEDPAALRKCQGLPQALGTGNPATIAAAVAATCPSPDPAQGFGNLMSFDGVHPSTRTHQIVANAIIAQLNQKHADVNLPTIAVN